jgi:hypothetical protein
VDASILETALTGPILAINVAVMPKIKTVKYYAVRVGRDGPRIYDNWDEVSATINWDVKLHLITMHFWIVYCRCEISPGISERQRLMNGARHLTLVVSVVEASRRSMTRRNGLMAQL